MGPLAFRPTKATIERIIQAKNLILRGEKHKMRSLCRFALAVAATVVLAGCGENDTAPEGAAPKKPAPAVQEGVGRAQKPTDAEAVKVRALARWQSLIDGDYQVAYGYISPGMRSVTPFEYYRSKLEGGALHWKAVDIRSVECEDARCEVEIRRTDVYVGLIQAMVGQETISDISERWIEIDGQWWFVPKS